MRLTIEAPYIFTKRNIYYFSRRVPEDLKGHYRSSRIVMSLKTKSLKVARTRSISLSARLEEDWMTLRWRSENDPFQRFLMSRDTIVIAQSKAPLLSEAQSIYLKAKQEGRPKTFNTAVDRCIRCLVGLHGDKPIDTYSRSEANQLRDAFIEKGLSKASIQRNLNVIRAILNFTTRELGLDDIRAFSGIYLGDDPVTEPNKRLPIPANTILEIQNTCHRLDDEARWLIALISDTGMRLSEAVGLVKADIIRDCHTPYIRLREHSWRRLKTRNSERTIPLVGDALWAVKRASDTSSTSFLFPRYCDETTCKGNSASAALNKWLSPRVPSGCVIHSFRHSLRDRLRAVECPPDIIDRIGGWSVTGIGETYGTGYPIEVISDWMKKMVKP